MERIQTSERKVHEGRVLRCCFLFLLRLIQKTISLPLGCDVGQRSPTSTHSQCLPKPTCVEANDEGSEVLAVPCKGQGEVEHMTRKHLDWSMLLFLFLGLFLFVGEGCGGTVCKDEDSYNSSFVNVSGRPCRSNCECNNQRFEGYCGVSGKCIAIDREPCQAAKGSSEACDVHPDLVAPASCKHGKRICQENGLEDAFWGNCKCSTSSDKEPASPEESKEEKAQEKPSPQEPSAPEDGGTPPLPEKKLPGPELQPEFGPEVSTNAPQISSIEGDGASAKPVYPQGVGPPSNAVYAGKRFQRKWIVRGLYLDKITSIRIENKGKTTVYDQSKGFKFDEGGSSTMRTITLPQNFVAIGLFTFFALMGSQQVVQAQVFVMQGEKGKDAAPCTITTTTLSNGTKVSISCGATNKEFTVTNGVDGKKGDKGDKGDGVAVADAQYIKDLKSYLSVETTNKRLVVSGANLQIVNGNGDLTKGEGTGSAANGVGNLILGYNEQRQDKAGKYITTQRTGSHNLIVGVGHEYTSHGTILAGRANTTSAPYSSVVGGVHNTASGNYASVSGGASNEASGVAASVSGGGTLSQTSPPQKGSDGNFAIGTYASVSGGNGNYAYGEANSVSGGHRNRAGAAVETDSNGDRVKCQSGGTNCKGTCHTASTYCILPQVTSKYVSISGGNFNIASGQVSSISGGTNHLALGPASSISGGKTHVASGKNSSVSGGLSNEASGEVASISGGTENKALKDGSSVSGGYRNTADANSSSILGGSYNKTVGNQSSVSGGQSNEALGSGSSILGGYKNKTSAESATIAGGIENSASGKYSSVSGGNKNVASGGNSTVSGATGLKATTTNDHKP